MKYLIPGWLTLTLSLVACGGSGSGPSPLPVDGLTDAQRTLLGGAPHLDPVALPTSAQAVDAATLADNVASGAFRFVTPTELAELAEADAATPARLEGWKADLQRRDPGLLASLGDLRGTPGDTQLRPMPGEGAVGTVRVNAPVSEVAGYVAALDALADVTVQRPAYAEDYRVLTEAATRSGVDLTPYGLTDPGRLAGADLVAVEAARRALETATARVAPQLRAPTRTVRPRVRAQSLDNPTAEDGAINIFGRGYYDRAGSKTRCEGWSATGLYAYAGFLPSAARWTSVKAQGNRGTCWAFALTAYMEDLQAQQSGGKLWNFGEQATTAFVKYDVRGQDKAHLNGLAADGEDTIAAFQALFDRKYAPVLETSWYYNAAGQWPQVAQDQNGLPAQTYAGVCNGYDATWDKVQGKFKTWCSETSHEYPVICTTFLGQKVCAVLNVAGNTKLYAAQTLPWRAKADLWRREPGGFLGNILNNIRIQNYAMAAWTEPVVISVDADYLQPGASGFVPDLAVAPNDTPASNHALLLVDYLTEAETRQYLPQSRWADGGYLVLRNSWGDCWGDSGFAYVPMNWARKFTFKYARTVN